ncbi:MAG: ATP-binding protein [Xanthomonadales bacterium]|nr:ATP-binding protein [Xanthomonadales bacterium]
MQSLQGRLILRLAAIIVAVGVLAVWLTLRFDYGPLVVPLVALAGFLAVVLLVRAFFAPINETLQALRSGVASFRDHDYSVTIAGEGADELGQLVAVYNELAQALREERFGLFQRELLLDTVIQSSSVAVVITNPTGSIVYANREARDFLGGEDPQGRELLPLCAAISGELATQVAEQRDGLVTVGSEDDPEVFHVTSRDFNLNARIHHLFLFKQLTREIARREVATWKKVIRVITHEINNSLAPIASLTRSARKLAESGDHSKLDEVFAAIGNRAEHLQGFIEQYARFARLPAPRVVEVDWPDFVAELRGLAGFELAEELPQEPGYFDPLQMQQVVINLLKNAAESGSDPSGITLRILQNANDTLIAVEDRGSGMNPEQMELALLPFYSTKREGTGLGLPLCREICEAHGGRFQLYTRREGGLAAVCRVPREPAPAVAAEAGPGEPAQAVQ